MKFSSTFGLLLLSLDLTQSFVAPSGLWHRQNCRHHHLSSVAFKTTNTRREASVPIPRKSTVERSASPSSDDGGGKRKPPLRSRLEGNTREPTKEEVAIMDEMITKLADAKPYELPNAVRRAFRVISSPRFFVRIAERVDLAKDETEKEKLSALSGNLVNTLEAVVETTEEQLDERAQDVENVVKEAAEPDSGEFMVPLLPERIEAMKKKLEKLDESSLDEGFLSTLDAWMNKSHQDGMDLMVGILQKVLQMYAGLQIRRARDSQAAASDEDRDDSTAVTPAAELFDKLLETDTELWGGEIKAAAKDVPPEKLRSEVQKTMETVVLGLENGSMAQQVQAEYLRELVSRIEAVQKTL